MDLKDFGAYVVKTFDVHGIEPYNLHFSSTTPEYLASFRNAVAKAGAHAVNIAVDQEKSFYDADSRDAPSCGCVRKEMDRCRGSDRFAEHSHESSLPRRTARRILRTPMKA